VAVIERRAEALAERARNGDGVARAALRGELERAAMLIGEQYVGGARDEDVARARLERSRMAQRSWPQERVEALHRQCSLTAGAMLGGANKVERFVVRRLAAKRMDRMLTPRNTAAASSPTASSRASEPLRR
jgi:hypothetical protein